MEKWNGKDSTGTYRVSLYMVDSWNMQIDETGSVYYWTHEPIPRLMIWCTTDKLTAHIKHMADLQFASKIKN